MSSQHLDEDININEFLAQKTQDKSHLSKEEVLNLLSEFSQVKDASKKKDSNIIQEKNDNQLPEIAMKPKEKFNPEQGIKKHQNTSIAQEKIQKINEVLQKKNERELIMIDQFKKFEEKLNKNLAELSESESEDDDDTTVNKKKPYPCLHQDCDRSYETSKCLKAHIIKKHKMLALEKDYIKFVCQICYTYSTNSKSAYEQHKDKCAQEHAKQYQFQGVQFQQKKLTKEQKQLLDKAKNLF